MLYTCAPLSIFGSGMVCVWDQLKINYSNHVNRDKGACHPVTVWLIYGDRSDQTTRKMILSGISLLIVLVFSWDLLK